jgi:hypothetical protein
MCRLVCTLTDWQLQQRTQLTPTLTLTAAAAAAAVLEAPGCTALLVALTLVRRGCRNSQSGSVAVVAVAAAVVVAAECRMLAPMQTHRLTFMSTSPGPLEVSYITLLCVQQCSSVFIPVNW